MEGNRVENQKILEKVYTAGIMSGRLTLFELSFLPNILYCMRIRAQSKNQSLVILNFHFHSGPINMNRDERKGKRKYVKCIEKVEEGEREDFKFSIKRIKI